MPTALDLFPPIALTIREHSLNFKNFSELSAFWTSEREKFRAILSSPLANRAHPAAQALANINQALHSVDSQINNANQTFHAHPGELTGKQQSELRSRVQGHASSITSVMQTAYSESPSGIWLSVEADGQFILELAKSSRDEAAFALLYLRGLDFSSESYAAKHGSIKAHLYRLNLTPERSAAEAASIGIITAKWRADSERMTTEMSATQQMAQTLNDEHAKAISSQADEAKKRQLDFAEFLAGKLKEQNDQMDAGREELKKLVTTYDQHMKLQAPVEYWRKKKERHINGRNLLTGATIIISALSFGGLGIYVWENFHDSPAGVVPWREILGFFVLSSLAFWVVKILVRLLMSSIHLGEDAAEREVMAMTYMALVRGDESKTKYLDEKDRALVLAPLFRPSSTGVIDDGAPPHISEIITKVGK